MVLFNALEPGEAGPGEETEAPLAGEVRAKASGRWFVGSADLEISG